MIETADYPRNQDEDQPRACGKDTGPQMGGSLTFLTATQMADVNPNRCGETVNHEEQDFPLEHGGKSAR